MASGFSGEIIHFGATRIRVTGSGNLQVTLNSLNDVKIVTLNSVAMQSTTDIEPTKLANFLEQRACLAGAVTGLDETFSISRIVIFVKPTYTGVPQ